MNAERLAYLRKISLTYIELGDEEPVGMGSDVLQLLNEREALLEALRDLVNWENGVQDAKDWRMFYAAAQAAIAKAEAE